MLQLPYRFRPGELRPGRKVWVSTSTLRGLGFQKPEKIPSSGARTCTCDGQRGIIAYWKLLPKKLRSAVSKAKIIKRLRISPRTPRVVAADDGIPESQSDSQEAGLDSASESDSLET